MHAVWDMRCNCVDNGALDRAHIADNGAFRQMRRHFGGNRLHRPNRHTQNDKISTGDTIGNAVLHVAQTKGAGRVAGLRRSGKTGDPWRRSIAAQRMANG